MRKSAYEAEIAAYEKVEDAIAFSLNYIKNQVTMLSEKRGYASPLAMTLEQSRMKRETLDAMMAAIDEYLPVFRKYLRKKGEMLGHANGRRGTICLHRSARRIRPTALRRRSSISSIRSRS